MKLHGWHMKQPKPVRWIGARLKLTQPQSARAGQNATR